MSLQKNEEYTIEITGMTQDGSGVGRAEDQVVFIPGCARGDVARVHIVAVRRHLAYGRRISLEKPSPVRVPSDCPVFPQCGGCAYRHIRYEEELAVKWGRVRDALHRIGGSALEPEPIVGCDETAGYRNKAQYPVGVQDGAPVFGFYAAHSHRIVPAEACQLQPPVFRVVLKAVGQWMRENSVSAYDEKTGKGLLRHVFLRQAHATGEIMLCLVVNGNVSRLPASDRLTALAREAVPSLKSLVLNVNTARTNVILGKTCVTLWGADRITDILCGRKFTLSPMSFYQVNSVQAERLYQAAAEFSGLDGKGMLLDLYCGAGTIGLCLSTLAERVIGVESVPEAVADAKRNAELNGIRNAEFLCADTGEAAERLLECGLRPDAVVVDPPRKGLSAQTIEAVVRMAPPRVVYISCGPETLARDIALFAEKGYACTRARPYDLFPRTAHVETAALLEKRSDLKK